MNRTIFNIFGPSTAGKSTTTDALQRQLHNVTIVDFDPIKRQIPDYHWKVHGQQGRDMTLGVLKAAALQGQPIILLYPSSNDEAEYNRIKEIADASDYTILNIEITAPHSVLIDRYAHRMANIDPAKKNWKFKTPDEFAAKLDEPYYRPDGTASFDTSVLTTEQIITAITERD